MQLKPYASDERSGVARTHPEAPSKFRSEFQRDRDRIIHSAAFRRLEYKTQVFVNHEGDMFRTRLTHSIEVAQIGRTVARVLGLNEDLTEAICLAHDLGHTPFGHAGQDALNACMSDYGGFEHNLQSLRIVDQLEEKYAAFSGLNLTLATREGILKHCSTKNARALGDVAARFLNGGQPSLEAQLANICDEIAYNNHDVDDGLRAGLLELEDFEAVELVAEARAEVHREWPALSGRRVIHETIRRMIDAEVRDLVNSTRERLADSAVTSADEVRAKRNALVAFSAPRQAQHLALKRFLRERLYQHYRVHRMATKARRIVSELFDAFMADPRVLPTEQRAQAAPPADDAVRARTVADYIAGMTDRYAIAEHQRIFDVSALT